MTSGTNADDAMVYTIASNQVNAIQAMKATRTLIVMTTGGEYAVSSGSSQDAITPTNINIRKQSNYGSSGVDALSIGNATIFLQRAKRKIRELAYNFDTDGYTAPDLTILSDHISKSGIENSDKIWARNLFITEFTNNRSVIFRFLFYRSCDGPALRFCCYCYFCSDYT